MGSLLPLFVAIPLAGAFLIVLLTRLSSKLSDVIALLAALSLAALSFLAINQPTLVCKMGGWGAIRGIPIGIYLVLDGLSSFILIIVNTVAFLVLIYSLNYMERYTDKARYYALFLLMLAGMNGVVLSGDMFNIFVFLELAAIASYALVAFGTEAKELEAAFKYQVMGILASCFILLGIALLYSLTGTLNMADIARILQQSGMNTAFLFIAGLFIVGFGLKSAIVPFHTWLPDAHSLAPAPISAMLSGLLIKVIGIYGLLRIIFNVLGLGKVDIILNIFLALGIVSIVVGALLALGQDDFKRLLAYSSISQIGYIIFAFGLGTPLAFLGGLFHLLNHATAKSLLFLNSGAITYSTGTRDLNKLGGLRRKMPITSTTSLIGSLSMVGLPPFGGFWSKLVIIAAAIFSGHIILASVAVLVSIVTLVYYLRVGKLVFLGTLSEVRFDIKEVPWAMCLVMLILALLCLGSGVLLIPGLRDIILDPAVKVLSGGFDYGHIVFGR